MERGIVLRRCGLVLLVLVASAYLCVAIGPGALAPWRWDWSWAGALFGGGARGGSTMATILLNVRLPRVALGALVGAALAATGVVFQGLLRNPLGDPYILGVSSGAAVGATAGILLGLGSTTYGTTLIPLVAFAGAVIVMFIVYGLGRVGGRVPPETLLLAGVIVNFTLGGVLSLSMALAERDLHEIVYLLLGNLGVILTKSTAILFASAAVLVLGGLVVVYLYARELNLMALGEEPAMHLGVDVDRTRKVLFVVASLLVGAVVSMSGLIGFVGLVIPHIVRMISGPDHRTLIPLSAMSGAILLMWADAVARTVAATEIPVGVVTALIGGPYFIYLLRRSHRTGMP